MWGDEKRTCWQVKDFHNVIDNARCIWREHHNGAKILFKEKVPAASKRPPERPQGSGLPGGSKDSDDDVIEVVDASASASSTGVPANVQSLPPGLMKLDDLSPTQKKASCAC